jgi:hypothetical protein
MCGSEIVVVRYYSSIQSVNVSSIVKVVRNMMHRVPTIAEFTNVRTNFRSAHKQVGQIGLRFEPHGLLITPPSYARKYIHTLILRRTSETVSTLCGAALREVRLDLLYTSHLFQTYDNWHVHPYYSVCAAVIFYTCV